MINIVMDLEDMPYKLRNHFRDKFPKARYKINNWRDYNKALQQRGSITLWLSDDMILLKGYKTNYFRRKVYYSMPFIFK